VIDGRIFRGGSGGAGEVGMTLIGLATDPDLPAAGGHFPQPGSLEALSSGHALDRFAAAVAAAHPDSALGRLRRPASPCSVPMRSRPAAKATLTLPLQ